MTMNTREFAETIYDVVNDICGNDDRFEIEKNFSEDNVRMGMTYYYTIRVLRIKGNTKVVVASMTNPNIWSDGFSVNCYSDYNFIKRENITETKEAVAKFLKDRIELFK